MESAPSLLMSQIAELVTVRQILLYERHDIMLRQQIKLACS
jgi:hypothetical protein